MPKYRKLPVEIEAVQFDGTPKGALEVFDVFPEIPGAKFVPYVSNLEQGTLLIPTLEGDHTASKGDWIIEGVEGEYYPCKPDIFEKTYELVHVNVKDDDGHCYYIPAHMVDDFTKWNEVSGRVWGCNCKFTVEEEEWCAEQAVIFTPMMTGGGPIE